MSDGLPEIASEAVRGRAALVERRGRRWAMRLPLPLLLAVRYLKSSRRDAYVSFLSTLAGGGITLGVAALILVLAGLSGLQRFLRSDVLARTPHLEVELPPGADAGAVAAELAAVAGVEGARRILRGRGWLLSGGGAVHVEMVGYEGELPRFFPGARTVAGSGETPGGLYLGDQLAARWGIEPGETVEVVSALPTLTPLGPQPRLRRLRVDGTFRTGATEVERERVALPLATARGLFGAGEERLEVRAADLDAALAVARRLPERLPEGSRVRTWQDLNRGLFFALKLEKMVMFLAVFLIVPVAAMSLVTVLALLISSKRGEIGMLQAMGALRGELRQAFLALGTLLGAAGLALGTILGVGAALVLDRYRLLEPPGEVYYLEHVPFRVEAADLMAVFAATALLVAVSTLWAARRAAALEPVEVLHQ